MKKGKKVRIITPSLPGTIFVARTHDRGRGVFTNKRIRKGQTIEISPMIIFSKKDREQINDTFLYEYYFEWGESGKKGAVALG
ncbi:MAG: hypothetical protein ACKVPJ_11475, partial [Chitinophagales bacterium]